MSQRDMQYDVDVNLEHLTDQDHYLLGGFIVPRFQLIAESNPKRRPSPNLNPNPRITYAQ